jgi:hypothetical protein
MYTGHIGIALGAKGIQKHLSLWLLCLAALMPDLIDFSAQLVRSDTSLWTHTLPGMIASAAIFFAAGWIVTRSVILGVVTGIVACSHVLADLLTSRLTLWPGGPISGLHWYLHPLLDFGLEAVLVLGGWLLYGRSLPKSRRFSTASFAMLILLLALQGYMATLGIS